jgi:16S rRNA G966 N2-methylase RsmD
MTVSTVRMIVGHVLDPFGGSGTTPVAAALEGRDATLIDLDPRNVALVDKRLRETLRVLSCDRDGDTTTWTVEPESTKVLAAIAAGQLELFAEGW